MTAGPKRAVTNCNLEMTEERLNDDDGLVGRPVADVMNNGLAKFTDAPTTANIVKILRLCCFRFLFVPLYVAVATKILLSYT